MAKEYPHAKFTGCNFVPTRHPHSSNIQLEVYNLHNGFHGKDETYDLIHMFSTFKFVSDYYYHRRRVSFPFRRFRAEISRAGSRT